MAVTYVTLTMPGGALVQVADGSQLHAIYASMGATPAPVDFPDPDPFPQYATANELAQAIADVKNADSGAPVDTVAVANITDATDVGRALLTAQDVDKAREVIGSTGLTLAELDLRYAPREQAPPPPVAATFTRTLDDVVYAQYGAPLRTDGKFPTWGRHELELGITATYDWRHGGRPGVQPPYPSDYQNVTGYDHHNVWGQVIPVLGGIPAAHRDVRVQFDLPQVWHLENGTWVSKKAPGDLGNLDGGYWNGGPEGYTKTTGWVSGTHFRSETVGYSFDCKPMTNTDGTVKINTSIAHWFFNGFMPRTEIKPGSQVAIVTRMRLISDNANVDLEQVKLAAAFSGDAFETATTTIGSNGRNPALVIPRHVVLGENWRHAGIVTGTEAQIRAYPPMPFLVT